MRTNTIVIVLFCLISKISSNPFSIVAYFDYPEAIDSSNNKIQNEKLIQTTIATTTTNMPIKPTTTTTNTPIKPTTTTPTPITITTKTTEIPNDAIDFLIQFLAIPKEELFQTTPTTTSTPTTTPTPTIPATTTSTTTEIPQNAIDFVIQFLASPPLFIGN